MSVNLLLMLLALICGWQAVRAKSLLTAALWLAGVSALVALAMYGVGAAETAVIELSVGAGLVTILFVFAVTIAGDEAMTAPSIIPKLLRSLLLVGILAGLGWFIWPVEQVAVLGDEVPFTAVLWQERGLDVLVQIGLIFAGVMGILSLLSEEKAPESVSQPQSATSPLSPAPPPLRTPAKEKLA
jgi:uncharacterized MnhB-related membrane protein